MPDAQDVMDGINSEEPLTLDVISEREYDDDAALLADLKRLPEAANLDDAALKALWAEAKPADAAPAAVQRAWKLFGKDGVEISDLSKLSASDFLGSQISYRALNAEQRRSLDEIIRVAQFGHLNEQRMTTLERDRATLSQRIEEMSAQLAEAEKLRKMWHQALTNEETYKQLREVYHRQLLEGDFDEGAAVSDQQAELQATQEFDRRYLDYTVQLAQQWNVNPSELRTYALQLIDAEPSDVLTWERVERIMALEIPLALERAYGGGAAASAPTPGAAGNGLASENASLKAQLANLRTKRAKARATSAPSSAGGAPSSGGKKGSKSKPDAAAFREKLSDPDARFGDDDEED